MHPTTTDARSKSSGSARKEKDGHSKITQHGNKSYKAWTFRMNSELIGSREGRQQVSTLDGEIAGQSMRNHNTRALSCEGLRLTVRQPQYFTAHSIITVTTIGRAFWSRIRPKPQRSSWKRKQAPRVLIFRTPESGEQRSIQTTLLSQDETKL